MRWLRNIVDMGNIFSSSGMLGVAVYIMVVVIAGVIITLVEYSSYKKK